MYKQYKNLDGSTNLNAIIRTQDNACIPFATDNTDYVRFKKEINEETAELQDADGNVMSAEEAKAYIATLPA